MKHFFVNNIKINYIPSNRSIIEYCENIDLNIPHYCYHPKLSIAGNCRMCLVEVKNSPKPVISCAMSLLNKMEIFTDSPLVKKSREGVLEFLLLNHPLDCPVCDQGGECDLQDQSFVFGVHKKRFYKFKRIVTDKNIGPIVKTVMTRCIHCTRCIRFSKEIAGVESLGIFGRGVQSEIGTYVNKVFNSELSGNIIDICPVGALTSKQYPFAGRIWELKTFKSIDYTDNLLSTIQVYTKSNSIVRISPDYDNIGFSNSWISDKIRFSFDGMFSPDRISTPSVSGGLEKKRSVSWVKLFDNIVTITYFQDHLSRHTFQKFNLHMLFTNSISIESLNMLCLLTKKYNFLKLRCIESLNNNNDLESLFLLNSFTSSNNLNKSNLCLIVNSNTRYENSNINIRLRQRSQRGNFKILYSGSLIDLTFPVNWLGSTSQIIKKLVEGTSLYCQDFLYLSNPTLLLGYSVKKRKDFNNLTNILEKLNNIMRIYNKYFLGYNLLNAELNESGIYSFNKFKKFSFLDFSRTFGLYLIDLNFNNIELRQLINLKLLNYFCFENKFKSIFELNHTLSYSFFNTIKKKMNAAVFLNLPNKVFFESSHVFLNNSGNYKNPVKIVPSLNKSKENWHLIRKISSSLSHSNFNSNYITGNKLIYTINNYNNFIKYIGLQFYPISYVSNQNTFIKESKEFKNIILGQTTKKKYYTSKFFLWLEDFYIGGKDNYSIFSSVMINCSKILRVDCTNFRFVI